MNFSLLPMDILLPSNISVCYGRKDKMSISYYEVFCLACGNASNNLECQCVFACVCILENSAGASFCFCCNFKINFFISCNIIFIACVYPGRCNDVLIFVQVELVCRVATVLLQVHHHQLITTPSARPALTVLKDILYARVKVIIAISFYNANRVLLGER